MTQIIAKSACFAHGWWMAGLLLLAFEAEAQWARYPVPAPAISPRTAATARTHNLALTLPFWDDFSFANGWVAQDSLWSVYRAVTISQEIGIRPPSLGVATFDGYNANGRPYDINNPLARGYADTLQSRPLRMDLVPPAQRGSTFIMFFYQVQGHGEAPDDGDFLELALRRADGTWQVVWTAANSEALDPTVFYPVVIPITEATYFHDQFQFRFRNFGRLSGPFDTWNIDYIFLDWNRGFSGPPSQVYFPDRTVTAIPSPLLAPYRAVPYKHFLTNPGAILSSPSFPIFNLCGGNFQPMNFATFMQYRVAENGVETQLAPFVLDNAVSVGDALPGLQRATVSTVALPAVSSFSPAWDSLTIRFEVRLRTSDETNVQNGDCAPPLFPAINFEWNDTVRTVYALKNYYAYDDGTAEYGAGLNQSGASVAYQFDMKTDQPELIEYIDFYFPRFGDEASRIIEVKIWADLDSNLGTVLHSATVPLNRTEQNRFWRYRLEQPVIVKDRFYVGWRQNAAAVIAVGLDNSNDTGDRVFFNTNGVWIQNTTVPGSLMIRPGFSQADAPVTSVEKKSIAYAPYPNPNTGTFFLPAGSTHVQLFNAQSQSLLFSAAEEGDRVRVQVAEGRGLVIVRYWHDGQWQTTRLVIQRP